MSELTGVLHSLTDMVDLGFVEVPMFLAVSAVLVLFGLGLRKSWLSFTGISVTFAFYFMAQMSAMI